MRVAVFSTKTYDRTFLAKLEDRHDMKYLEPRLDPMTAALAADCRAACRWLPAPDR